MTDKLSGIKPGDRVRVTFEGEVKVGGRGMAALDIAPDGSNKELAYFDAIDYRAPTFHIERIEKPLAVGDRVRGVTSGDAGEIIWMNDTYVVIVGASHQHPLVKHLANVERIS